MMQFLRIFRCAVAASCRGQEVVFWEITMQKRFVYDRFAVRTLHAEDPLLDALEREHGVLRKRLDEVTAQRRGVTPMHFHPKRPNNERRQQEES